MGKLWENRNMLRETCIMLFIFTVASMYVSRYNAK